jgi:hypothetical protein
MLEVEACERRILLASYTLNPVAPILGEIVIIHLTNLSKPPFFASGTGWSYQIKYNGKASPPTSFVGSLEGATLAASIPGHYLIWATTTYQSGNPTVKPPAPATTQIIFDIAPPDHVAKPAKAATAVDWQSSMQAVCTVTAGGQQVGPNTGGIIQEATAWAEFWNDKEPTIWGPWGTVGPRGQSISFFGGLLNEQFPSGVISSVDWWGLGVGQTILDYVQELEYTWTMPDVNGGTDTFTISLNNLEWVSTKASAGTWGID